MENHTLFKLNRFLFFITQPPSPSPPPPPPPSTPDFFTTIFLYIKQWLTSIPNLFIALLHKLDQAIPPETRTRILTITAVSVAIILLLLLIFCFLSLIIKFILFIARACWTILTFIVTCLVVTCCWVARGVWCACVWVGVTCQALCCGPVAGVMMKAPGTAGLVISRALFEGATQAYFAASRAGALVVRAGTVVGFPGA